MKLAIIHAPVDYKISARLTKIFTDSTAYHCGFVDESDGTFFDMNWLPRKIHWPRYGQPRWVNLYDIPELTRADCEEFLKRDSETKYGVGDYIMFGLKPIFHLFGKSTPNVGGTICSEMCANWMEDVDVKGWKEFQSTLRGVPSPADLERWAKNR